MLLERKEVITGNLSVKGAAVCGDQLGGEGAENAVAFLGNDLVQLMRKDKDRIVFSEHIVVIVYRIVNLTAQIDDQLKAPMHVCRLMEKDSSDNFEMCRTSAEFGLVNHHCLQMTHSVYIEDYFLRDIARKIVYNMF
jgi:hypothetical protein